MPSTRSARRATSSDAARSLCDGAGCSRHPCTVALAVWTRPAASASRCSGSRPSCTASTTAATTARCTSSSLSAPRQMRSQPAARASTAAPGSPRPRATACMSTASLTSSAVEPELLAQHRQHGRRQGGGLRRVERRQEHVRGHHGDAAGLDGCPERDQLASPQSLRWDVDGRQGEVRVDGRVAVTGEVLRTRTDAGRLEAGDEGGGVPGDQARVRAEAAYADHRVVRVAVDVDDRREVEVDPGRRERRSDRARDALGEVEVVHRAECGIARVRRSVGHVQPGDVAGLLIDGDEDVRAHRVHRGGQRREVVGRADVGAERADRAQAALEQPRCPLAAAPGRGRSPSRPVEPASRECSRRTVSTVRVLEARSGPETTKAPVSRRGPTCECQVRPGGPTPPAGRAGPA